jgi:hypothetical protein
MHRAKAAILNDALAPLWRRLRDWVSAAMHNHEHARDHLTRDELAPMRTAIFEIEALLRRLVLVAATAVTVDFTARWSLDRRAPARQRRPGAATQPTTRRAANTFRLFNIRWSKTDKSLTTTVAVDEQSAPPTRPHTNKYPDTLTSGLPAEARRAQAGPSNAHGQARPKGNGSTDRAHISRDDPEMSIEDFERWRASYVPDETSAQAAWRQEQEVLAELERAGLPPRRPQNPTGPRLERKTVPQLLDATQLQAYLAHIAHLVANPEALIQRAARAMARRREIAWRLSQIAAPRARGALATSIAMCAVIIPFHNDFVEVMQRFALSHTEPDTT